MREPPSQGEKRFLTELEILFEYKHENIIGLVGYCNENNEQIIVYEYASNGSLDRHVNNANLTWTQRLKIGIDVAVALDFLHVGGSTQNFVIHRDIKSANILITDDWKAKVTDFGMSIMTPTNNEIDFMVDDAYGMLSYVDPQYYKRGYLTIESDIYALGVVLCEMMSGRTSVYDRNLVHLAKQHYEEGKVDELVFDGIKDKIVPKSLIAFVKITYECLHEGREERPTASEVALQLKKALEFQVSFHRTRIFNLPKQNELI